MVKRANHHELRLLHTAQPSLSRQIRDLENDVGTQLLTRNARGIELTAAGKVFLDHARPALIQVDAASEAARRAAKPKKPTFVVGFLTGQEIDGCLRRCAFFEMSWLRSMSLSQATLCLTSLGTL